MQAKGHLVEQTFTAQPAGPSPFGRKSPHWPPLLSRILPHDTTRTTCPPAPLVSGAGPIIIVPSIMRSGTHLLLDAMFNNFPALRRKPLFVDFDAYERASLDIAPLELLTGVVIKTHYPQVALRPEYVAALASLAERAVVISPRRPANDVRHSLAKWNFQMSEAEFGQMEKSCQEFWEPYSPTCFEFSKFLNRAQMNQVLQGIHERTGLTRRDDVVMPAKTRWGVYVDKILTRLFGGRVPRVNTTIGYRLGTRRLS